MVPYITPRTESPLFSPTEIAKNEGSLNATGIQGDYEHGANCLRCLESLLLRYFGSEVLRV